MKYTFTDKILLFLAHCDDLGILQRGHLSRAVKGIPSSHKSFLWVKKYIEDKKKRQKFYSAISGLKRTGYLQKKNFEQSEGYMLTNIAKKRILRIEAKLLKKKKLSSKEQIMVFFDIPEKLKLTRESFRGFLKELGFEQLQKSIWITSFDTVDEVKKALINYEINDYVQILKVKNIK